MRNLFRVFTIVLLVFMSNVYSQTDNLTILYFGDTHSCLAPLGPRNDDLSGTQGGIARAASLIGSYKMSGENVLALHAGDYSIGDLFFNKYIGIPELQLLNSIGLDAMTVGNHEFDLGPENFYYALNTAFGLPSTGFPLLSANADLTGFPALGSYVQSYTTKDFDDLKVGIFGLTTHAANLESNPSPVVIDEDFITRAYEMVVTLKTMECDFIILLSHYGFLADQAIATYVPGINLIVSSHDHYLIDAVNVNGTWIAQAKSQYQYIGKIDFQITGSSIIMAGNEMIHLNSSIPEEPTVKATVDFLISEIEAQWDIPFYTQQIARAVTFLEEFSGDVKSPGNHSTAAGNFITDALLWKTDADLSIQASGSIAQPIYQGPLVPADLFRAVGYGFNEDNGLGFRVVTFDITGMDLYTAIEIILTFIDNEDYLPQFAGLKLKYIPQAPEGQRVQSIVINNKPLNPFAVYKVASNEFVPMILNVLGVNYSNLMVIEGYSEFQLLVEYTAFIGNKLTPVRDARVIAVKNSGNVKKEGDIIDIPSEFALNQNYPNPFNPSTEINFSMPSDSRIKIAIYNILGEEVAMLIDDYKSAGNYSITWNASSLPAGIYIYSLQSEAYSATRKMVLLK
jgi:5'-nucleotidase / UDP-sugar diphosphatase